MSNDQIARPLLVEIKGETYEFSPLTVSDITGMVTDYLKMSPVADLIRQKDAFEPEVYGVLLEEAKKKGEKIELGTSSFNEELVKMKNLFYMFWVSLRKKHPKITKKVFDEMILDDKEAAKVLLENLGRIISIADSEPKDDEPKEESTREVVEGTKKKTAHTT